MLLIVSTASEIKMYIHLNTYALSNHVDISIPAIDQVKLSKHIKKIFRNEYIFYVVNCKSYSTHYFDIEFKSDIENRYFMVSV